MACEPLHASACAQFTELTADLKLKAIPLEVPLKHCRAKLGWARKSALDEYVRKNHLGDSLTFEQLQGVLERVGIGDSAESGIVIDVGGRVDMNEQSIAQLREMDADGSGCATQTPPEAVHMRPIGTRGGT